MGAGSSRSCCVTLFPLLITDLNVHSGYPKHAKTIETNLYTTVLWTFYFCGEYIYIWLSPSKIMNSCASSVSCSQQMLKRHYVLSNWNSISKVTQNHTSCFSPPARWGSLDFIPSSVFPPSPSPPLCLLLLPARRDCGLQWTRARSQAPDAAGHAGTR